MRTHPEVGACWRMTIYADDPAMILEATVLEMPFEYREAV
jgi:hypothetical protein